MRTSMRKVVLVNVRVTVAEAAELRKLAREAEETVSGYIRSRLFLAQGLEERVSRLEAALMENAA
jgi:hypothetical protein